MQIDIGKGYGDAWPGGPWIHSGNLPAGLGAELLYFCVSQDGRIVGQTGPENHARYWNGSKWFGLGVAPGTSVAAFHPTNGRVYVSGADGIRVYERDGTEVPGERVGAEAPRPFIPGYAGSQGIRWIDPDGTVHTGDSTYSGPPLWEWTRIGNIRVGQGGPNAKDEGVRVIGADDVLRALNHDVARFIRVHQVVDRISICYLRETDGANVRILASEAELLAAAPVVSAPPVQPPPLPVDPPKEPKPVSFPNHLDIVQRERAKYPLSSLTEEQCFRVTNAVASDPAVKADGWGLTKAPAGGSGFIVNGQNYRLDKLCHPSGFINDILSDTPGAAGAQWGPNADSNGNPSNWAPAVALDGQSQPPVQPPAQQPAQPQSVDLQPLKDQIAALEARLSALEQKPAADDWHGGLVDVTVTGSVSWTDALYGRKVTWSGKGVIK